MAQPYLNALEELVASELTGIPGLVCKHFFSGAALYANGTICATLTPAGIAFKLPEQRCSELIESGKAFPLRYFAKSPVKRGYVLFTDASSLGNAAITSYLKESLTNAHVQDAYPSIERTCHGRLRLPRHAAHVELRLFKPALSTFQL